MIEDKATERLKERLKKMGLIVNMGADKTKPSTKTKAKPVSSKTGKKGGT
jgi:hypothetical protein